MYKKHTKYFILSILFFMSLGIVFSLAVLDNPNFNIYDLAMNLLSEFAGMIFTVLIFNEFLNQKEKLNMAHKSKFLYQELECWISNLEMTFMVPAQAVIQEFQGENLWKDETFSQLCSRLHVDGFDSKSQPQIPWYLYFAFQGEDLEHSCKSLQTRFQEIQEPEVTDMLGYFLNNSSLVRSLPDIKTILESDSITGFKRSKELAQYYKMPQQEDYFKIEKLKLWVEECRAQEQASVLRNKRLSKFSLVLFGVVFPIVGIKSILNKDYLLSIIYFSGSILYLVEYWYYTRKKRLEKRKENAGESKQ